MDKATYLRSALASKKPSVGFWLTFAKGPVAATILEGGGFDWVLIDAEHGQITDADYFELNNIVASRGASPIIRVPNAEEYLIKRALDSGAHGVMTPMCHSAEDAKKIVAWNKYPPKGTRGFGPMFSAHSFHGMTQATYPAGADSHLLVIVQIESKQGLANVEEIAKVDGIDILFIGPYDLSKFLGVEFGGKEHEAAIAKILKAAKDAGKYAAIFCSSGAQSKMRLEQGFDMVSICTDVGAIAAEFDRQLAATHGVEMGKGRSVY
ncbi:Pyruvate/Phosphoenolpyruvate kinase-like domain-containing protein [Kockovaella imperatae]|uniref:Pyruvate/Phosphoenolpyruvate kinase-like domain-containing protein n=1 Tax=Kockovaella imperatae TaxID=4999 RepID=A0A1Y1UD80_9TREE|nr:Pyruvate/Phosphoenolpyruvate kinase-like domain-containing protein [Kockovaella imperatae]ORX35939.1 Pyruvate/Phosphoenolpyruvate kinase-like domain-containing protein [Kockovaella imperatae]